MSEHRDIERSGEEGYLCTILIDCSTLDNAKASIQKAALTLLGMKGEGGQVLFQFQGKDSCLEVPCPHINASAGTVERIEAMCGWGEKFTPVFGGACPFLKEKVDDKNGLVRFVDPKEETDGRTEASAVS